MTEVNILSALGSLKFTFEMCMFIYTDFNKAVEGLI